MVTNSAIHGGPPDDPIEGAYTLSATEVAAHLGVDPQRGLSEHEAKERLELYGPNVLERSLRPAYLTIAARQLMDALVALLMVAAIVSFAIGDRVEATAIFVIVILNGVLGFTQEAGAERAIHALSETLGSATVVVSDKTGTLTENRLRVHALAPTGAHDQKSLLQTVVLASTAVLIKERGELKAVGDPIEGAFFIGSKRTKDIARTSEDWAYRFARDPV